MKTEYIKGHIEVKDNAIDFVVSDETLDRHGDVIPLESWDLDNFRNAPRMLVDHDHRVEKIVGRWEDIRIDKSHLPGLKMSATFHKITDLSKEVFEMVKKGFLDTVSVGFIPHSDIGTDTDGKEVEIQRNELIEVSLVTVPANPNASQIKILLEAKEKKEATEKIEVFLKTTCEEKEMPNSFGAYSIERNENGYGVKFLYNEKMISVLVANQMMKDIIGESDPKNNLEIAKEKQIETPLANGKSNKGRSLSIKEKQNRILRTGLKEAVKVMNFTLNKNNQAKYRE